MNKGLSDKLATDFSSIVPEVRPFAPNNTVPLPLPPEGYSPSLSFATLPHSNPPHFCNPLSVPHFLYI